MKFSVALLVLASSSYALAAPKITPAPAILARQEQGDHDHDHDHDHSGSIPPPPAESTGCELHDDHYHCEGPATGIIASAVASSSIAIPPAPAESAGCELHGDHSHCEGAATSVVSTYMLSGSSTSSSPSSVSSLTSSVASSARSVVSIPEKPFQLMFSVTVSADAAESTPNSANFAKFPFAGFWFGLAGSGCLVMGAGLV